eukprot:TRINITY_DN112895_c0_g1_i1.p1 TRINITY_DN112895_c0_g1~~TRINITY_DN112895_c0_g1_i1.p1  ORF type:complete len:189 (-),score=19.32 TRINITY_DN112895_c0_g1_i1:230-796(-)
MTSFMAGQHVLKPGARSHDEVQDQARIMIITGLPSGAQRIIGVVGNAFTHHSVAVVWPDKEFMFELATQNGICDWACERFQPGGVQNRMTDMNLSVIFERNVFTSPSDVCDHCDQISFNGMPYVASTNNCQQWAKELVGKYGFWWQHACTLSLKGASEAGAVAANFIGLGFLVQPIVNTVHATFIGTQ